MKVVYQHQRLITNDKRNKPTGIPLEDTLFAYGRSKKWLTLAMDWPVASRGGHTACLFVLDDTVVAIGESYCSLSQNFSYKEGRRIALNRAIDDARLSGYFNELEEFGIFKSQVVQDGDSDLIWSIDFEPRPLSADTIHTLD